MIFRSLTSRLIATVLGIEVLLACFVTVAGVYYQRRESVRAFDIMLQGRADTVLGAVQDAEDNDDNVMLDKSSIHVPKEDVYEVREASGRLLGSSKEGQEETLAQLHEGFAFESREADGEARNVTAGEKKYRARVLRGDRLIDPDQPGSAPGGMGTLHHIVVYYASPTRPLHEATERTTRFLLLADALALLVSVAAVAFLIRRSLRPLDALAKQAALLTPNSWTFTASPSAYELSELAPLAAALDTALQGLDKAYQQQRSFLNDAAHELKTAVTILKSSLQLLSFRDHSHEPGEARQLAGLEGCLSDCGRMEELVQRMLLLARVEQVDPQLQRVAAGAVLSQVVRQVMTQLESAASLRRVVVNAEVIDHRRTSLSEEDCSTLLVNLLMNAIQHSNPGSSISVQLKPESEARMTLTIIDQGEGIAPEHLPFVFEKFYRTDASRSRDTGGTGLGLAICKAIVEGYGGHVEMESKLAHGTTVRLLLPVFPAATENSERTSQTQDASLLS